MQDWLAGLVGEDLAPILFVLLAALFVAGLAVVVIRLLRGVLTGGIGLRNSDGPRVEIVDVTAVDPKRKLVLVRRDQVEHLILIGGANDLVIESRIGRPAAPPPRRVDPEAAAQSPAVGRQAGPVMEGPVRVEPRDADPEPARPAPFPSVRAPQTRPVTPPVPVAPLRATADAGPRMEPVLPPEPPQEIGRHSERTAAPAAASEPRSERIAVSPAPSIPAVAPAADRAPMAPSAGSSPVSSRPTPSVIAPPAPPVEPQPRAVERRPAPMPQVKSASETPKGPMPSMAPSSLPANLPQAPARPAVPEWPVRDTVETPQSGRTAAPAVASPSAAPVVSPPASPSLPAVPPEERPLVVRSFASTIGERRSGPVMPAPPMVAPTLPAPAPARSANPAPTPIERELDDDLLADLTRQLEMPDEPDVSKDQPPARPPAPTPSVQVPSVQARSELSLEDEMQRLLRDFSAHTGDRR